jgi:hypothetical protein
VTFEDLAVELLDGAALVDDPDPCREEINLAEDVARHEDRRPAFTRQPSKLVQALGRAAR